MYYSGLCSKVSLDSTTPFIHLSTHTLCAIVTMLVICSCSDLRVKTASSSSWGSSPTSFFNAENLFLFSTTKLYTSQELFWTNVQNFEPAHFVHVVDNDTTTTYMEAVIVITSNEIHFKISKEKNLLQRQGKLG